MKRPVIFNDAGKAITLTEREARVANFVQRHVNALGYEVDITTLTTIMKKITEQKFFQIAFADFLPVKVGEGAWSAQLTTYLSYDLAGDFSKGLLNTGAGNSRLSGADSGISSVTVAVNNWAKAIAWNIIDLQMASKSGSWDIVTAKEKARKRNWDLGLQATSFMGLDGSSAVKGLLNQSGITTDTTTLAGPISGLSTVDLKQFCSQVVTVYRNNCERTAWPKRFIIPESDFNGLAATSSPDFPVKSTLQLLEETFKTICGSDFKIMPLSYCDAAYNPELLDEGKQQYVLHSNEEESGRMDIPVDYTSTIANSFNNFEFQNAAYGQFTGYQQYRPQELYYFKCPVPEAP